MEFQFPKMRLQKIFSYDLKEKYKQAAVLVASGTGQNHADLTSCDTLFFKLLVMIYKRLKTLKLNQKIGRKYIDYNYQFKPIYKC